MTGTTATAAIATPRPPPGPALDHQPTRAALHRRRRHVHAVVVLAGLFALSSPLLAVTGTDLWGIGIYGAPLSLLVAGGLWRRWRWMHRLLASTPWVGRRGLFLTTGSASTDQALLLLDADEHGPAAMGALMSGWMNGGVLTGGRERMVDVWVAGDPADRALASVGRDRVVPIAVPRWGPWRRYLEGRVARRLSPDRPDLHPVDPPW